MRVFSKTGLLADDVTWPWWYHRVTSERMLTRGALNLCAWYVPVSVVAVTILGCVLASMASIM